MSDTAQNSADAAALLGGAGTGRWVLDPAKSSIAISHKSMWGLVTVGGPFTDIKGEGEILADGTVHGTLTIAAASIQTGKPKLDTHLRSADFFNTDVHPSIVFTALGAKPVTGGGAVDVSGRLDIAGVSEPLSFTAETVEATSEAVTLQATVAVDRARFGLTWNQLGAIKGLATVSVTARFARQAA